MVFLPCHRFLSCSHAINLLGIFMSYHKCSKAAYHNTVSVAQRLFCEVYEIIHNGLNIILAELFSIYISKVLNIALKFLLSSYSLSFLFPKLLIKSYGSIPYFLTKHSLSLHIALKSAFVVFLTII